MTAVEATPDTIVVGSGLAGLSCALALAAAEKRVTVVTPGRVGRDGASHRVAVLAPWILLTAPWVRGDSPRRFAEDVLSRSRGLARDGLLEILAAEAHGAALELVSLLELEELGDGPVTLPGEALPRGRRWTPRNPAALLEPLIRACRAAGVRFFERTLAVRLLVEDGRAAGVLAFDGAARTAVILPAASVVLACGGVGAVFPVTTAPRWCHGGGVVLAGECGALLHRPSLTQALPVAARPPLVFPTTDALLRGCVTIGGVPMSARGSLDEATREIAAGLLRDEKVALAPGEEGEPALPRRIRAAAACYSDGAVPLTVALHHTIGGVAIDAWGRTSVPGLYACGESAGGVQGAQRTMGTGLLEARIFALRVARALPRDLVRLGPVPPSTAAPLPVVPAEPERLEERLDALMGPLVVLRGRAAVHRARAELGPWPASFRADPRESDLLAGLRRAAALRLLDDVAASGAIVGEDRPDAPAAREIV